MTDTQSTTTETNETKEPKPRVLNDEVIRIAGILKEGLTMDSSTGQGTQTDDHLYKKALPEGLKESTVKAVYTHDANFIAAGVKVVGDLSIEALASNPELKKTNTTIRMTGRDRLDLEVARSKTYPIPAFNEKSGSSDELIEKYGVTKMAYHHAPGTDTGQVSVARDIVSELAQQALAGK